ncbi:CDP-alcohol phosphatidyltransferase family protein [Clostridium oryzae]|uniref:Phosphatidylglycerophosphate synthase n=1 Tax=Clostridium oryzae TaxID=1450648 RepID=A0A1V4ISS6_9CLOT|nr:CDP-alcohol phosphatidyltransferase family protein [Clostridium oryzae]OPJ62855.1 CDP-diacylglycerol--glycerol-3-phosphate 3-phosphatidyltransferase [Clostridium oryzae]
MKNIPNIISILRILLSATLFVLKPLTLLFLLIYSICGFSDIIDGYIARKTNSASRFGSILDSIADIIFMSSVIIALLPILLIPIKILIWIMLITFARIVSLLIVYFKYHTFAILHTYANKATGLFLFCCPYLFRFVDITILGYVVCAIASLSAIEELVINITSKELLRNNTSIFMKQ